MCSSSIVARDEDLNLASTENIFYEHPESTFSKNIKLQEYAVMAINFVRARS
jgi:hypothetical protein